MSPALQPRRRTSRMTTRSTLSYRIASLNLMVLAGRTLAYSWYSLRKIWLPDVNVRSRMVMYELLSRGCAESVHAVAAVTRRDGQRALEQNAQVLECGQMRLRHVRAGALLALVPLREAKMIFWDQQLDSRLRSPRMPAKLPLA